MNQKEFHKSLKVFKKEEGRADFYDLAINLINNNFEIEGFLLILSTWNFAGFRYSVKEFDIGGFRKMIQENLKPYFDKLKDKDFNTINFDQYTKDIEKIYTALSKIKGISYTGASKIMHLKNPKLFVMWDRYIRGEGGKKYYKEIESSENGYDKRYAEDFNGYLDFLKDMQNKFKGIKLDNIKTTLSKAIDEYNYVNITLPMLNLIRENKEKKKKAK